MENGNKYRLQKIKEIQKELETEKENRKQLEKKYKKGIKAINVVDYILCTSIMGLNMAGVSLLATVVATPAAITTEAVSMGAAVLFIISRQINKKLILKIKKHEKIKSLIEELLNKISDNVSTALNDNKITDEEFSFILAEVNNFLKTKEKLRTTSASKDESFLHKIMLKKR